MGSNIRVITPNDDIDTEREYPGFRADKEVLLLGRDFTEALLLPATPTRLLVYHPGDFANLKRKIVWEQKALEYAQIVVFWFSEASAPEMLFTLGCVLGGSGRNRGAKPNPKIIIGVHPDSPHRELIKNQLIYWGSSVGIIADTLPELVEALEYYL